MLMLERTSIKLLQWSFWMMLESYFDDPIQISKVIRNMG